MAVSKQKPRAYELAKELGVPTKELVAVLAENGVVIKSNFSLLEADAVTLARKFFRPLSGGPKLARELDEKEKKAQEELAAAPAAEPAPPAGEAAPAVPEHPAPAQRPRVHASRTVSTPVPVSHPAPPPPAPAAKPHPKAPAARPAVTRPPTVHKPAAAKPPPAPKHPPKPTLKGPQPAAKPMPGLLSKPPPPPPPPPEPPPEVTPVEVAPLEAAPEPARRTPAPAPAPEVASAQPPPPPAPAAPEPAPVVPIPEPAPPAPAAHPVRPVHHRLQHPTPPPPPPPPAPAIPAGPLPARASMPGLLSAPAAAPTPAGPIALTSVPAPPPVPQPLVAAPPSPAVQSTAPQPPVAPRPRPSQRQGPRPEAARQQARPAPKPVPQPPRLVYFGPSPAPADYETRPRPAPRQPATILGEARGPAGPHIRPQTIGVPRAGRPGGPASTGAPRPTGQPAAQQPGQKTIFRLDEKEEERKRREAIKEAQKEEERKRKDAQREAQKRKQETYQARSRARSETSTRPEQAPAPAPQPQERIIRVGQNLVVTELANLLGKNPIEVVTKLISLGTMASINQRIDFDVASIVANEFGCRAVLAEEEAALAEQQKERTVDPSRLKPRPPVVTVMGHVDHGKTSLLDAIRDARVAEGEHGGITQHIGAYQVKLGDGHVVTFLDTPGHEAFTAMRAHGAKVTDCAVLVIAADDGVMLQTEEAAHHAQAAGVPIIVAINKIDKPGANLERVKQQLTKINLLPEEWGGKTICVPVSATKRQNIQQLLEMIVLQAEMLELKADPDIPAEGVIVESELDKGRGPVATVLIQEGSVHVGDPFTAGATFGKVRALLDDRGRKIKQAGPGTPVKVMGFNTIPDVATNFNVVESEARARELAEKRQDREKLQRVAPTPRLQLEELFKKMHEEGLKELKIIIKGDTHGSVTALSDALSKVSNEEVRVVVIHGGVGEVSENDVMFAAASDAIIIGFHVRPSVHAQRLAGQEKVDVRFYNIIYEAVDEVQAAIRGMLTPKFQEVVFGHAQVRQAFTVPKAGKIAGSYVTDGKIIRNFDARVLRDGVEVYSGKIASLKRFKEDAKEVPTGFECGIGLDRFNDIKEHDVIEVFKRQEIPRE